MYIQTDSQTDVLTFEPVGEAAANVLTVEGREDEHPIEHT